MEITAGAKDDGLVLTGHWEPGGEHWVEVVYAAPRARFATELLEQVRRGDGFPFTELDEVKVGGVLRIRARDRTLVYRLTEHDPQGMTLTGEWPDLAVGERPPA